MKRVVVAALALLCVACGGKGDKRELNDIEKRIYRYQEQILEAMGRDDREAADHTYDDMCEWVDNLEPAARQEAEYAIECWRKDNAERIDAAM